MFLLGVVLSFAAAMVLDCGPLRFRSNAGNVWQTRGKVTDESCELFAPCTNLEQVWFLFVVCFHLLSSSTEWGFKLVKLQNLKNLSFWGFRPHCTKSQNSCNFDSQAWPCFMGPFGRRSRLRQCHGSWNSINFTSRRFCLEGILAWIVCCWWQWSHGWNPKLHLVTHCQHPWCSKLASVDQWASCQVPSSSCAGGQHEPVGEGHL